MFYWISSNYNLIVTITYYPVHCPYFSSPIYWDYYEIAFFIVNVMSDGLNLNYLFIFSPFLFHPVSPTSPTFSTLLG